MMKVFALLMLFSSLAQAQVVLCPPGVPPWECDRTHDRWPDRDIPGHAPRYGHTHPISCAPEVVQGNIAATDRVLTALSASAEFAEAARFKSAIAEIASLKDANAKVAHYFSLIGVDARDSKAVADFIGAREVRNTWLTSLQQTTGLSNSQAETVASKLQNALRGDLQ